MDVLTGLKLRLIAAILLAFIIYYSISFAALPQANLAIKREITPRPPQEALKAPLGKPSEEIAPEAEVEEIIRVPSFGLAGFMLNLVVAAAVAAALTLVFSRLIRAAT